MLSIWTHTGKQTKQLCKKVKPLPKKKKQWIDWVELHLGLHLASTNLYFIDSQTFNSIFCFIYIKFHRIIHCTKIQWGYVVSGVCLHLVSGTSNAYISRNKRHVKIWAVYNARCCQVDRAAGLRVYQYLRMLLHLGSFNTYTDSPLTKKCTMQSGKLEELNQITVILD